VRKTVIFLVFVSLLLLSFLLGFFLAWTLATVQEEPTVPHDQVVTTPPEKTETPDKDSPAETVVPDIRNVPEENPATPEAVAPPVEGPSVPEIVLAVPLIEAPPLRNVISDIPLLGDEPAAKQEVVLEPPKPLGTVEPAVKPASYFYVYTGVPVQMMPVNVVAVSSSQWFVTPVFVPQVIPVRVRTYHYFYSTGFVTTTIVY